MYRLLFLLFLFLATASSDSVSASPWLPPPGLQEDPAFGNVGSRLLTAWTDLRSGASVVYWSWLDAAAPDTSGVPVFPDSSSQRLPAVSGDTDWGMVAWESWGSDGSITVQAASVLETDAIAALTPVSLNQGEGRRPVLAVSSSIALVLWEDSLQGTLRFARWDKLGGLLDPGGVSLLVGIAPSNLAVTTTSLGFLAVWTEQPAAGTRRVRVGFWDASGNHVITHDPLTAWGELNSNPTLAALGNHAVVVWHTPGADGGALVQQQLDASGYPVGAPTTLTTGLGLQMIPKVYGEGAQYDLLWTHQDGGGRSLKWAVMDSVGALTPSGGYEVTSPSEFAADGAVTRLGNASLVAYRVPDATDSDDLRFRSWMGPVPAAGDTALVLVAAETTGIHEEALALAGPRAWPNPFRHATRVPGHRLEVFDIRGARVRFLKGSGGFLSWDGRDERGVAVPNGVYLLRSQGFGHTVRVVKVP